MEIYEYSILVTAAKHEDRAATARQLGVSVTTKEWEALAYRVKGKHLDQKLVNFFVPQGLEVRYGKNVTIIPIGGGLSVEPYAVTLCQNFSQTGKTVLFKYTNGELWKYSKGTMLPYESSKSSTLR